METWSLNLFLASTAGTVLAMVVGVGAIVLGLAAMIPVTTRLEGRPKWLRSLAGAGCLFGIPLLVFRLMPMSLGEVVKVDELVVDGTPYVVSEHTWISNAKGASIRHRALRSFRVEDGAHLGDLHLQGGLFATSCGASRDHGALRICLDPPYDVRDALDFGVLTTLQPTLDAELGADAYRITGFEDGTLVIERTDGRSTRFPLDTVAKLAKREVTRRTLGSSCSLRASKDGTRVESLLRAARCPGSEALVLHRSTAFGPGEHLVSWWRDGAVWTTSLAPWVASDTDDVRVLDPVLDGAEVQLWLIRDSASLVRLRLDVATGEVRAADVVF